MIGNKAASCLLGVSQIATNATEAANHMDQSHAMVSIRYQKSNCITLAVSVVFYTLLNWHKVETNAKTKGT